ncbi:MAG: HAMP domain-containing histidine kinase [Clostridia bacterium]|nr:HAMP domain-containing histidine kinase [Clostridia bacterium]
MTTKLKRTFVTIAMISVAVVLGGIYAAINIVNYVVLINNADALAARIYEEGGEFREDREEERPDGDPKMPSADNERPAPFDKGGQFGPETPFETRYFTVRYDGGEYTYFLGHIAAVKEAEAQKMFLSVDGDGKKGFYGTYRYLVKIDGDQKTVVFVDSARQLDSARKTLIYGGAICLIGLALVFPVALLLSGKAVGPIAESYEKQKRFIADAGHELKTPLTVISANNELIALLKGEDEYTRAIDKQVKKMSETIRELTALTRMGEETKLEKTTFDLGGAVRDCIADLSAPLSAGGRKISADISDEKYSGDEKLLRKAVELILDNCAKYALTFVDVKLVRVGKNIKLTVKNDTGGIADGDLSVVFDRFYRTAEVRASGVEGSGIGLAVVKDIVLMHGGKVAAYGRGGVFAIEISL